MSDHKSKNSTVALRIVCAILFFLFTFVYLHYYQADVLAAAQHVLSDGQTHYVKNVGTGIIILALYLLHLGVLGVTRLTKTAHALTYFPSFLVLAFLTNFNLHATLGYSLIAWTVVAAVLLVIYVVVVWFARQMQLYDNDPKTRYGLFSRAMWKNLFIMVVMMFVVGLVGNSNDVFHHRVKIEKAIVDNQLENALSVGKKSLANDSSLTALRILALSKSGLLGERLFEYPLQGGSKAMIPDQKTCRFVMLSEDSLYRHLGARPRYRMSSMGFLNLIHKIHMAKEPAHDYLLCAYLLDKRLDDFAREIGNYYKVDSFIPKHYREALILHNRVRSHPIVEYSDNVLNADYKDFLMLTREKTSNRERKNKVRDTYGNTYWYYYEFE
ncbi:MAG: hypothetical protein IKW98_05450 [Prevotella sp.]|nr:hypothetical protein [Prevotella sp.]